MAYIITETDAYDQEAMRAASPVKVAGYRVKEVYYGDRVDIEIYPYWGKHPGRSCRRVGTSRKGQKNQNAKDSRKMFVRLLMHNFGRGDLHVACTYSGEPPDEKEALKDAQCFIRRWQAARKRAGLKDGKYMRVIEGAHEGSKRTHVHFVLEDGVDRDTVERLWDKGYCNADRIRAIDGSIKGLAEYLAKDPKGRKRWGASRGLKRPEVKIYDRKLTRKRVRQMAECEADFADTLKKLYPGYRAAEINPPKYSEYVTGVYLSADMRRAEYSNPQTFAYLGAQKAPPFQALSTFKRQKFA